MASIDQFRIYIATFGLILSTYALYVKYKLSKNPRYTSVCDLSNRVSCTYAVGSRYSVGFGFFDKIFGEQCYLNIPNSVYGIAYYLLHIFVGFQPSIFLYHAAYYLSIIGVIGTIYLAYILFFVLEDICIICIPTYFVNIGLFMVSRLAIRY
ncbi:hypothetical protein GJ496_008266 [Pomphorhynchus laevis]|nr:hypothetical protein GJ496_008266 [Pomphorhynchus laevis]